MSAGNAGAAERKVVSWFYRIAVSPWVLGDASLDVGDGKVSIVNEMMALRRRRALAVPRA